jgi:serine O-acetyltransferase
VSRILRVVSDFCELLTTVHLDLLRAKPGAPMGLVSVSWYLVSEPGIATIFLLRLQQSASRLGRHRLARLLYMHNARRTGAEFAPGCQIGSGLVVKHPVGIVVSGNAVIGNDCTLMQNATIGETLRPDDGPCAPIIGNRVLIGASASVLGAVRVGDGARIGANSVILRDVEPGATAVGSHARN